VHVGFISLAAKNEICFSIYIFLPPWVYINTLMYRRRVQGPGTNEFKKSYWLKALNWSPRPLIKRGSKTQKKSTRRVRFTLHHKLICVKRTEHKNALAFLLPFPPRSLHISSSCCSCCWLLRVGDGHRSSRPGTWRECERKRVSQDRRSRFGRKKKEPK
jgi:hypothetical protein